MDPDVTLSVPEVTEFAALAVEQAFPGLLWVEGEICNLNRSAKGHVYFSLIEPGADRRSPPTQLPVTLLEWNRQKVNLQIRRSGGNIRVEDGVRVRIRGSLELYRPRGQLQLRMIAIDPAYTLGTLAMDRARLMAALAAEGLLDANAALPVPRLPLRVALVTSLGSAAHADFVHEIETSTIGFRLLCVDTRVQGLDAPPSVATAIRVAVTTGAELICVVRGGGARTDLAAFDHETVARAIASCPVPVWVGVGHEVDRTVADEVAHSSFKTPTACAAKLVEAVRADIDAAEAAFTRVRVLAAEQVLRQNRALGRAGHAVALATRRGLERGSRHLEVAAARLGVIGVERLDGAALRLDHRTSAVTAAGSRILRTAERDIGALEARVRALDPARIMERGWSLTRTGDGTIVRSVRDVLAGDEIVTQLVDGRVRGTVHDVEASQR